MIEVEHLTRYYQNFPALRDITARIDDGEIVGFLGLNGAGKTTMLRVLAGLLPPSAGKVTIDGIDLERAPASFRRKIGFLPDEPPLYREMRVADYLAWCGELKGCSPKQARDNVTAALRTCGIADVAHSVIEELSFGYRKRVGIAQAIVHRTTTKKKKSTPPTDPAAPIGSRRRTSTASPRRSHTTATTATAARWTGESAVCQT